MSKNIVFGGIIVMIILVSSAFAQEEVGTFMPCQTGDERSCGPIDLPEPCKTGVRTCENGQWTECVNAVFPEEEVCTDGIDNDCNGSVDDCYFEFPIPGWVLILLGLLLLMGVWVHEKLMIGKKYETASQA
jgi:hypothetical protein